MKNQLKIVLKRIAGLSAGYVLARALEPLGVGAR